MSYRRSDWVFGYKVLDVLEGARTKLEHYEGRLKFWEHKRREIEAEIRERGLEIVESGAGPTYNVASNTGMSGQVVINTGLQLQFRECHQKIAEHQANVHQYSAWVQVLADRPPNDALELAQDDWLFFFGKR